MSTSIGSLVGGVSPPSDDSVKVALQTTGELIPRVAHCLVKGVSKIESHPLGLEDVTGAFMA
jgi:hypothetical protein